MKKNTSTKQAVATIDIDSTTAKALQKHAKKSGMSLGFLSRMILRDALESLESGKVKIVRNF